MRGKECANADETSGTAGRGVEGDAADDGREGEASRGCEEKREVRGRDCANADDTSGTAGRGVEVEAAGDWREEEASRGCDAAEREEMRRGVQRAAREAEGR